MATATKIADHAIQLADQFLAAHRGELAAIAAGDIDVLTKAAALVRTKRGNQPEIERGAEHVAFALVVVAYSEAAHRHGPLG